MSEETSELDAQRVHELFRCGTRRSRPRWRCASGSPTTSSSKTRHDLTIHMEESAHNGRHIMFTVSLDRAPVARFPNRRICNAGMTCVRLDDEAKIEYQRDRWDLDSMFLGAFPKPIQRLYQKIVGIFG